MLTGFYDELIFAYTYSTRGCNLSAFKTHIQTVGTMKGNGMEKIKNTEETDECLKYTNADKVYTITNYAYA